ncbi:glycoside hydrolase family 3 N-terminal domain-containing protein [Nesterenkonia haasae]|uniref:glycoside hydrolase family 3 N-terminal domain-containing protein n=1 Tax=Nesterenkonia haasae TaxID=2587813 RepID=UPI0013910085|nr:glycoside hydrolase family 3 N-terminal domain-containing protein [Nesterenkonia haasae]NDK32603.1 glycosyl hydrolase [Nesterenkonia haasae]
MTQSLTPLEKAALLSGENVWQTRAVPRAGIREIFLSDGPHGIRKQGGSGDHLGLHSSEPATCFPPAATIANSWDPQLGEKIGAAIGAEAVALGVDVVLGPGLNIKRSPLCGRNFEYFSEDPRVSGAFAAAYVRGIQSAGVAACPKHFAANSQETRRMVTDSVVDERTLREIYLTGFEMAVREAGPKAIMSSYNKVNGYYAHENPWLLTQVLREEWGFDGVVVSDWGGSNDAVAAIRAGGTLEMPAPGWDSVLQILTALEDGSLSEDDLTSRAQEIADLARSLPDKQDRGTFDTQAHHALARRAAGESAVLLKNEADTLPLALGTRTAVIGDFALTPRYQGAGSSLVNPTRLVTGVEATQRSGLDVIGVAQGFVRNGVHDPALVAEAVALAERAEQVVLWLGLDEISESEGLDRPHLDLPANQLRLLSELAQGETPIVVVLSGGSAVDVKWMGDAQAVLHGYLCGQAGAEGILDVLTGEVNPSGRLAETYPQRIEHTPTAGRFPETGSRVDYLEGPLVGYRWYLSAGIDTALPFGYGLSYTTFEYSNLTVDDAGAHFTLTNTGDRAGAEVAQLYVHRRSPSGVLRPVRELAGFAKVQLQAGENRRVHIPFDQYTFRHWDASSGSWETESGQWQLHVGANAEDIRVQANYNLGGTVGAGTGAETQLRELVDTVLSASAGESARAQSGTHSVGGSPKRRRREINLNDPLMELSEARSPLARLAATALRRLLTRAEAKGRPDLNLLFLSGMPIRDLAKMSGGAMNLEMAQQLLRLVNGRHVAGLSGMLRSGLRYRSYTRRTREQFRSLSVQNPTQSRAEEIRS